MDKILIGIGVLMIVAIAYKRFKSLAGSLRTSYRSGKEEVDTPSSE